MVFVSLHHRSSPRNTCLVGLLLVATLSHGQDDAKLQALTGSVVDSDGKPLSKTSVYVIRQSFGPFRQSVLTTKTDADGNFRIEKFAKPDQRINVRATVCTDSYLMSWKFLRLQAGEKLRPIKFELDPAREITFRLVDSDGKAMPGVTVIPRQRVAPDGSPHIIFAQSTKTVAKKTDKAGRVKFNLFNTGDTVMLAIANSTTSQRQPIKIKQDVHELNVTFAARTDRPRVARFPMPKAVEPDAAVLKRFSNLAVRFNSIDPANDSFEDLQPLKEIIGNARVVMLGEQSHGDGACFETKIRLIKFLHQEMGFDVVAFESGLFDCRVAWQEFQAGKPPTVVAKQGVFGIWTASRQVQPLFDYMGEQASGRHPLELAGFDCQFTAAGSQKLTASIQRFAQQLESNQVDAKQVAAACKNLDALILRKPARGELAGFQATMDRLSTAARQLADKESPEQREARFWSQMFLSLKTQAAQQWSGRPVRPNINVRDRQMAENLIWLAREFFPQRKIIVWAASLHLARNVASITPMNPRLNYSKMVPMGHLVHKALGDKMFSIAFTAGSGQFGNPFMQPIGLPAAPSGTMEDLFRRAKIENGLFSFRLPGAKEIQPIYSRPLAHQYMRADWSGVFDAMIFNKTMTASTR